MKLQNAEFSHQTQLAPNAEPTTSSEVLMESKGVTAVDRAFSIIEAFKPGEASLSLQTLAARTGLNKATIIRLIASLEKAGCMSRLTHGAYALGPSLLRYGGLYQSSFHLADYLLPILRALVHSSGETAAFFVRDGDMRICMHRIESNSALRLHLKEGDRHPLLPGGTGKTLLAFSADQPQEFAQIRENYFVLNIGEREPEISSVSAPVLGAAGELLGAVSLTGPTAKFIDGKAQGFLRILLPAAAELTRLSGGDPAPFNKRISEL
ncbi:MAG: DNA-binding IclR family transcriptional regulator [Gammaproteobacteria bacterium]